MPSTGPKVRDILGDPLSDISRKERRNLLAAGAIGIFVVWTGVVPTKIATLGIEFGVSGQRYFLVLLGIVVGYFLIAFLIYGIADYFIYRETYHKHLVSIEVELDQHGPDEQPHPDDASERVPKINWVYRWSHFVVRARQFFEYVLPIALGVYAIVILIHAAVVASELDIVRPVSALTGTDAIWP